MSRREAIEAGILYALASLFVVVGLVTCVRAEVVTGEEKKAWIKTLQNQEKNQCCNEADGQGVRTEDWDIKDGHYIVKLPDGVWHRIEPWMLVTNGGGKTAGYAIVWTYQEGDGTDEDGGYTGPLKIRIRCFYPGTLG